MTIEKTPYLNMHSFAGTDDVDYLELNDNFGILDTNVKRIDTKISNMDHVSVKDFGALGNGITDDMLAFQAATNYVVSKGGGTVNIPPGVYIINESIEMHPGVTYQGQSGTIIKKAPMQTKFARMFTLTAGASSWNELKDSLPINFFNISFDSSRLEHGPYEGYELEQMSTIFLTASDTAIGKLVVNIENCQFKEGTADAISVYKNVKLNISNATFWNYFRGSVVLIGAGSTVNANNLICGGDAFSSFFQAEVEGAVLNNVDITLTNSTFYPISTNKSIGTGLDIGVGSNSNVTISNCYFGAGIEHVGGLDGTSNVTFSNCISRQKDEDVCVRYGNLKFNGCTFLLQNNAMYGMSLRSFGATNLTAVFNDCQFKFENNPIALAPIHSNIASVSVIGDELIVVTNVAHGFTAPGNFGFTVLIISGMTPKEYNGAYYISSIKDVNTIGLTLQKNYGVPSVLAGTLKVVPVSVGVFVFPDELVNNNRVIIDNCFFDYGLYQAFSIEQGGRINFENNKVDSFTMGKFTSANGLNTVACLSNNSIMENCRVFLELSATNLLTAYLDLTYNNQQVPVNASAIRDYIQLDGLIVRGNREVYDNDSPQSIMRAYPGDVFYNNAPSSEKPHKFIFSDNAWKIVQSFSSHIETLTADPIAPAVGRFWFRTDL